MNQQDQISYLANIYHVVMADGGVDRLEERVFEDISREIGAGYFERKGAMKLAQEESYQFQTVSRWSDRIRNLEDMLFAASCNGVIEPAEKKIVIDGASRVAINSQQFKVIKSEAKARYTQHKAGAK